MDEKKAIEMGKLWMKNSKDPTHDYSHSENVAKHSLKIFESLKNEGWEICSEVDENLVLLCAWWHDCYKALFYEKNLCNELLEGIRSAKIVEKELKGIVSAKRLKLVCLAIRRHNNIPYILFSGKKLPILTRILIEADALDAHRLERKEHRNLLPKSVMYKWGIFLVEPFVFSVQRKYIKSSYAKCRLNLMKSKKKQ